MDEELLGRALQQAARVPLVWEKRVDSEGRPYNAINWRLLGREALRIMRKEPEGARPGWKFEMIKKLRRI